MSRVLVKICMNCKERYDTVGVRLGKMPELASVERPNLSHGLCAACFVAAADTPDDLRERLQFCLDLVDGKVAW